MADPIVLNSSASPASPSPALTQPNGGAPSDFSDLGGTPVKPDTYVPPGWQQKPTSDFSDLGGKPMTDQTTPKSDFSDLGGKPMPKNSDDPLADDYQSNLAKSQAPVSSGEAFLSSAADMLAAPAKALTGQPMLSQGEQEAISSHPAAKVLGTVFGGAALPLAMAAIPGVGLPVAFGAAAAIQHQGGEVDKLPNPDFQPTYGQEAGSDALAAGVGAVTGKIFGSPTTSKVLGVPVTETIAGRVGQKAVGVGATQFAGELADQDINRKYIPGNPTIGLDTLRNPSNYFPHKGNVPSGQGYDIKGAAINATLSSLTYGIVGAALEVPALRSNIVDEGSRIAGKPLDYNAAKKEVQNALINPESLSPDFIEAAYNARKADFVQHELQPMMNKYGISQEDASDIMTQGAGAIGTRQQVIAKLLAGWAKTDPEKAAALGPYFQEIGKGADPTDIMMGIDLQNKILAPLQDKISQVMQDKSGFSDDVSTDELMAGAKGDDPFKKAMATHILESRGIDHDTGEPNQIADKRYPQGFGDTAPTATPQASPIAEAASQVQGQNWTTDKEAKTGEPFAYLGGSKEAAAGALVHRVDANGDDQIEAKSSTGESLGEFPTVDAAQKAAETAPTPPLRPESIEKTSSSPIRPTKGWETDAGSMPGEPSLIHNNGAVIEKTDDQDNVLYEARNNEGQSLGIFPDVDTAKKAVEATPVSQGKAKIDDLAGWMTAKGLPGDKILTSLTSSADRHTSAKNFATYIDLKKNKNLTAYMKEKGLSTEDLFNSLKTNQNEQKQVKVTKADLIPTRGPNGEVIWTAHPQESSVENAGGGIEKVSSDTLNKFIEEGNKPRTTIIDGQEGISASIMQGDKGRFHVRIYDKDSNETVGVKIFNTQELANEYANKTVKPGGQSDARQVTDIQDQQTNVKNTAAGTTGEGTAADAQRGSVQPGEQPGGTGERSDLPAGDAVGGDGHEQPGRNTDSTRVVADSEEGNSGSSTPLRDAATEPARHNFKITDSDHIGEGTPIAKYDGNIAAIKILKAIEAEDRQATLDEQKVLVKYVGWGGLASAFDANNTAWAKRYKELKELLTPEEYAAARASTINAHYTAPQVIKAIWQAIGNFGFNAGRVLEPSAGVGHFVGLAPQANKKFSMVELDSLTGRITKQLYPKSDVQVKGLQEAVLPSNFFDLIVSNIPFSDYKPFDPKAKQLGIPSGLVLHDYFFAKSLAHLRPGGVIAFITSKGTMDKGNTDFRKWINERAKFLGAIRLPSNAFKANAGTEVVTDIIFLQKPLGKEPINNPDWMDTDEFRQGNKSVNVNRYFLNNPEKVLGKIGIGSGLYSNSELTVTDTGDFQNQLSKAIDTLPKNIYGETNTAGDDVTETEPIEDHTTLKQFGYTVQNGKLFQKLEGKLVPQERSAEEVKRMEGLINVRDAIRDLLSSERNDLADAVIEKNRKDLNKAYDAFVKKYGALNRSVNDEAFSDDPDSTLLLSLENIKKLGKNSFDYSKGNIFKERAIRPHRKPVTANGIKDAIFISLGEYGKPDWKYVGELLKQSPVEAQANALRENLVFKDPVTDSVVLKDEYLSGNVKQKLKEAQAAARADKDFERNVEALKAVQPADLTFDQIHARIGMPWISLDVYRQFLREIGVSGVRLLHNSASGAWQFEKDYSNYRNYGGIDQYGTSRMPVDEVFKRVANGSPLKVFDKTITRNADGTTSEVRVLNEEETALAEQKADLMKEKFSRWFWEDDERREQNVKSYNENWNNTVVRKYDGSHLVFPSMNVNAFPEGLRKTQLSAIWRGITSQRLMLAHSVGAGKTAIMITTAMESKRLGLVNKNMVVAPKNTIPGWKGQINKLYPSAKVLIANEKTFSADKRKKFLSKIALGDWDIVVIPEKSFEFIQVSKEAYESYINQELDELRSAKEEMRAAGSRISVKNIETAIKKKEEKLKEYLGQSKKDDFLSFEELGIDSLMVDEADKFKNLAYTTQKEGIKGMGTATGSMKASDMMMKTNILRNNNGKIIFATGTPISNSMVEAYTMMKYLQPEMLKSAGIHSFDDWANTFGEVATNSEVDVTGGRYKMVSRFKNFVNVAELMKMIRQVWDIQTQEMLEKAGILVKGKNLPLIKGGTPRPIILPNSEDRKAFTASLMARAEALKKRRGPPKKGDDNLLSIMHAGRQAAIDMRLIDPTLKPDLNSKVEVCIQDVLKKYKESKAFKGTQVIFLDRVAPNKEAAFNPQYYMKSKMVAGGIPSSQIAFVQDYDTEDKKDDLFQKVNDGDVRVLFGSTETLGAGTNIQERLASEYHIDVGMRPRDMIQREGRIVRPGNTVKEVEIHRYATKGSLDTFMFQMLEAKLATINSLMEGDDSIRSISEDGPNEFEELKALSSDNPMVKEKSDIDREVMKLKALNNAYIAERTKAQAITKKAPQEIADAQKIIKSYEDFKAARPAKPTKEDFSITIGKDTFKDKAEAFKAIQEVFSNMGLEKAEPVSIGKYLGYNLLAEKSIVDDRVISSLIIKIPGGIAEVSGNVSQDAIGTFSSLDTSLFDNFTRDIDYYKQKIAAKEKELGYANDMLARGFEKEKELQDKIARQSWLDKELQKEVVEAKVDLGSDVKGPDLSSESGQVALPIDEVARAAKEIIHLVSPVTFVPKPALDAAFKMKGTRDKIEFMLERQMKDMEDAFGKMPQQEQIDFIDRIKTGTPQPTKSLQAIADMMRKIEDNFWNEAKVYKPSLTYLDNHYRVLWKVIPGSKPTTMAQGFKGLFRRPLQGSKGFMKQHTLNDMSEGLAKGGVPYSYNPVTMWRNAIMDMQKFITAQRMFKAFKDMGYVKFVRFTHRGPAGFVPLNDSIAKVYFRVDEGLVNAGEWQIEENAGRILNNFLSRDLIRESAIGGSLMKLKNVTTAIELSLSPFHFSYVSLAAMAGDVGLGLNKIINRGMIQHNGIDFLKGLGNVVSLGATGPVKYVSAGTNMIKYVSEPAFKYSLAGQAYMRQFPQIADLIDDLFQGGGKLAMNEDYKINSLKAFQAGIKNQEPWAVAISAIPAANEFAMKPLFEIYIPRMKVGAFLYEFSNELNVREGELRAGTLTRAELARQVWGSVENRFGEMNFDNLFWNRTFKSSMQLLFRSVTWKLGALKNMEGGTVGQFVEIAKAIKEDRAPLLNRDTAWLFGVALLITAFSQIIMHCFLHRGPQNLKDVLAPQYDKEGNRISLNTHLKDYIHLLHSPMGFITNSMSGEIGRTVDVWNNKDFYGDQVYNPDDKVLKKAVDIAKHIVPVPFMASNQQHLKGEHAPKSLQGLVAAGVAQPTPSYMSNTNAMNKAYEIQQGKYAQGSRTQAQAQASQAKHQLLLSAAHGDYSKLNQALAGGQITRRQFNRITAEATMTPLQRTVTGEGWTYDDVAKVIAESNPDEIKQIMPTFIKKANNAMYKAYDSEDRQGYQAARSEKNRIIQQYGQ